MSNESLFDNVDGDCNIVEDDDLVGILLQQTDKWYVMNICHIWVSMLLFVYLNELFIESFKTD